MPNYFVIGDDKSEYGPVSAEDMRKWLAEGRLAANSQVRAEDATDWRPLSSFPELAGNIKAAAPPSVPQGPKPVPSKLSAMAVASLVLGIMGLFSCGGTALFGLVLGIIAIVKISGSGGTLRGRGLAVGGVIVSGIILVMLPVFIAMFLPALSSAHDRARQIKCMNNERQLCLSVRIYAGNHTNQLPPAVTWCDALKPVVESDGIFDCPAAKEPNQCGYAFNAKLDGMDLDKAAPNTVMIFESDAGWNAHGGMELLADGRHRRKATIVGFVDGSVQIVQPSGLDVLRWDPREGIQKTQ